MLRVLHHFGVGSLLLLDGCFPSLRATGTLSRGDLDFRVADFAGVHSGLLLRRS